MSELMTQLSSQTSRLLRDEMRLAQKEFVESAKHAGIGAGLFSAAGLLAVFGLGSVITAAIAALSLVVPVWATSVRRRLWIPCGSRSSSWSSPRQPVSR